jgi:hypothetical protein
MDCLDIHFFTMRTNSTVSNNESNPTITIINDDYPRVIKEVFFAYNAFDINRGTTHTHLRMIGNKQRWNRSVPLC